MNRVYLLIGGNTGDRITNLAKATKLIKEKVGFIKHASSIYETAPWGIADQPAFLNQVLLVETLLTAKEVLEQILVIEQDIGRTRAVKFGPRKIDIDILFFNEEVIESKELVVPHPELQNRRFVLVPLNEIAGSFVHPVLKKSIKELLDSCEDTLEVKVYA